MTQQFKHTEASEMSKQRPWLNTSLSDWPQKASSTVLELPEIISFRYATRSIAVAR